MLKDYGFYVQCNNNPLILIKVVAENYNKAIEYVKTSYAASYSIYADERENVWHIAPQYCYCVNRRYI